MTINEAITQVGALKPHQYTDDQLIKWLSNLDQQLWEDVVKWHHFPRKKDEEGHWVPDIPAHGPYSEDVDMDQALMVPDPYSDVYPKYLAAQIDYHNGDIPRYNNAMIMYNLALKSYTDWLNRRFLPLQSTYIKTRL